VDTSVDLETGIITNAGASFGDVSDQSDFLERVDEATETLAERGLSVEVVVADKGHHSGENLAGMEERRPVALISSPNTTRGKPGFRREDFCCDEQNDSLICPMGKVLSRVSKQDKSSRQYRARGSACRGCPHFGVCTTSKTGRSVSISAYEELILANRERVHSEEARPLIQIRRQRGEAPFGYFKMFGGLRRFAGRGLAYAVKKTLIAALGWNLLILIKRLMRAGATNEPVSALIQLICGLCERLWRLLWPISDHMDKQTKTIVAMPGFSPPESAYASKAALSGGC